MALHDAQELDNDLRGRADEHLALAAALGVDDVVQAVILRHRSANVCLEVVKSTHEDGHADHFSFLGG